MNWYTALFNKLRTYFPVALPGVNYYPVVLTLLIGSVLSVFSYYQAVNWTHQQNLAAFEKNVDDRISIIQNHMDNRLALQTTIASFFDASTKVDRSEFQIFVRNFLKEHKGIRLLEWIPRVAGQQRLNFEQQCNADADKLLKSLPDFQISEIKEDEKLIIATQRENYYPILYVEPLVGNELMLGVDLGSHPQLKKLIEEVTDSGHMSSISHVSIGPSEVAQHGMTALYPVYKVSADVDTPEQRRQALL